MTTVKASHWSLSRPRKLLGDQKMAGRRHGQEFGEPLHDAQEHGIEDILHLSYPPESRNAARPSTAALKARVTEI